MAWKRLDVKVSLLTQQANTALTNNSINHDQYMATKQCIILSTKLKNC